MLFNSYVFILFFLPITLALYYGLNRIEKETAAKVVLVGMSLWFYAYFQASYIVLIGVSILFNYGCSKVLLRLIQRSEVKKLCLCFGIFVNLAIIIYFKYFNFLLENINWIFHVNISFVRILMPLGISFFTFQQISYLVDSYRGETKQYSFLDYALFVTFFPQLVAGPIVLHEEMIPQFCDKRRKKLDPDELAYGIWFFAIGLFKKVMIADTLGKGVDWGFSNTGILTRADVVVVALLYTLQIYFDFSGYCDMACGIAKMFHIDLPQNFDSPYKATSILEFWQRWHMSLTRFLRKYIYFPLGGNRKGKVRTLFHIMVVFLVSGIWHGAEWTFVLWGLLHGIANVCNRIFEKQWKKVPRLISWFFTFAFVNVTWIIFRAENMNQVKVLFSKLIQSQDQTLSSGLLSQFDILEFTYIEEHVAFLGKLYWMHPEVHLFIVIALAVLLVLIPRNCFQKKFVPSLKNAISSIVLLVWSILSLSGLSAFLYFNF